MSEYKDLFDYHKRKGSRIAILLTFLVNYVNFAHIITKINDNNNLPKKSQLWYCSTRRDYQSNIFQ